jgi:hypothetical protein
MQSNKAQDHRFTLVVVAVLSVPGLAASAAVPAFARELGGIRLGMTMEEVKAAAAAHQPPLNLDQPEVTPIPDHPGKTFVNLTARSYVGRQPSDFEVLDIIFSTPPMVPRVVSIIQLTGSSDANAPSKDRLQKTLREKFGGPPARGYPGWVWKSSGTPAPAKEAENCLMEHGTWLKDYAALPPQATLARIKDASKICGLVAVASAREPRLVSITITDYAALADALAKTVESAKESPAASRRPERQR